LVNSAAHVRDNSTIGEKCAFLARSWASYTGDLCNFWAKKLTTAQIYANTELNNLLLGKFVQILLGGLADRIV